MTITNETLTGGIFYWRLTPLGRDKQKKNKTRSTFNTKNLHTRINIYIFARMKLYRLHK